MSLQVVVVGRDEFTSGGMSNLIKNTQLSKSMTIPYL